MSYGTNSSGSSSTDFAEQAARQIEAGDRALELLQEALRDREVALRLALLVAEFVEAGLIEICKEASA